MWHITLEWAVQDEQWKKKEGEEKKENMRLKVFLTFPLVCFHYKHPFTNWIIYCSAKQNT